MNDNKTALLSGVEPATVGSSVLEEVAARSSELFVPDFRVYADRGSDCVEWD